MEPLASLSPRLESFHRELSDELHAELGERRPVQGFGAAPTFSVSLTIVQDVVRNGLNAFVQTLGPLAEPFILANKDQFRLWIGEPSLEWADRILHGLEDAKARAGA